MRYDIVAHHNPAVGFRCPQNGQRRTVIQAAARRAALVNAAAEHLHRWRIGAGDVEAVGIVKNAGVAVGGGGVHYDLSQLTCRGAAHCDTETQLQLRPAMTALAGPVRRELTETTQPQSAHAAVGDGASTTRCSAGYCSPRWTGARPCGEEWTSLRDSQPPTPAEPKLLLAEGRAAGVDRHLMGETALPAQIKPTAVPQR